MILTLINKRLFQKVYKKSESSHTFYETAISGYDAAQAKGHPNMHNVRMVDMFMYSTTHQVYENIDQILAGKKHMDQCITNIGVSCVYN